MEGHVEANDSYGLVQVVLADDRGYMLTVEAAEMTDALRTGAERFFHSFEILPPAPNIAVDPNAGEAG